MISALTLDHTKVVKEVNSEVRWMVLSTFSVPSTELINLESGEVKSFGDGGLTAGDFTATDETLSDKERHDGFEKMSFRRKFGFYEGGEKKKASVKKASVHVLQAVESPSECFLSQTPDRAMTEESSKYIDMIHQQIDQLKKACDSGRLRGIAIAYVTIDEDGGIAGSHNFITDGRGVASLNAGIDLVKNYIVETMRDRFGVKK